MKDPPELEAPSFELVKVALAKRDLSALENMLVGIARQCEGFGVVLWQERKDHGDSRLFVVAHGFEDPKTVCAFDALPSDTATGGSVGGHEVEVEDCATHTGIDRENDFYRREIPGSLLSIGIEFHGGTRGALTLYRRSKGAFPGGSKHLFRMFAALVPDLYEAVLDRIGYDLVERVSNSLERADHEYPGSPENALIPICQLIRDALGAHEVSVFLEDQIHQPNVIQCKATTCKPLLRKMEYRREDDGFTPYVWREAEVLRVLHVMHADVSLREKTRWRDAMGIEAKVREELGLKEGDSTPPISFAAVPIVNADKTLGVLRCHLRPRAPYYFAERDVELLNILASRIASFWARRLRSMESDMSRASWLAFVDRLNGLAQNIQMRPLLATGSLGAIKQTIYKDGLQSLKDSVAGLDIVDIALVDRDSNMISTAAMVGAGKELKLPASPANDNAWAYVLQEKAIYAEYDTGSPKGPYKEFYPRVKQAIFIPIITGDQCVGAVSLRSLGAIRDPNQAKRLGQLLALVVSLYELLATLISAQSQMYRELEHQLRTPVFQARKRAASLLEGTPDNMMPDFAYDIQALNGLMAKTHRVLGNMRVFEDLALGQKIAAPRATVNIESVLRTLGRACADHKILWRTKGLTFSYDSNIFDNPKVRVKSLKVDQALFEQIVNNVLDNSSKYSATGSAVTIEAYVNSDNPQRRRLVLVIKNKAGVPLTQDDVNHLGEKGFRSSNARNWSTDGSGLGLYIVKNIMAAHNGELRALPTDPLGTTRIELVFPLES